MRWTVLAAAAVLAAAGCDNDPVMKGRRLLDKDPAGAAALFREAAAKKSPCFDCDAWLGYALERQKDVKGAIEAYERALALPESRTRPEPVAARLLGAYETLFRDNADPALRLDIATKAAPLEAELKVAKPWANPHLFDVRKKAIAPLAEAGKSREVAAAIDSLMALYLTADMKKAFGTEATELLRTAFVARVKGVFESDLAAALDRDGIFEPKTGEVVLANRFTIPSKKDDPRFDPGASDFATTIRKEACLPLRKSLEDLVARVGPVLKLHAASAQDLDWLFADAFKESRAGWADHGPADRSPAGQAWRCEIRLPLARFLGEMYRLSE